MITRDVLTSNWNFMRIFRLGVGIFIGVEAIRTHDFFSGLVAAFFLYQAVTNTGCCGINSCSTSPKNNSSGTEDVEFEEVKTNKN